MPDKAMPTRPQHQPASTGVPLSRRAFLPSVLGAGAALATVLSLGAPDTAQAQSKVKQAVAKYQDKPKNGQKCSDCRFFRPPKSCQLVEGDISPDGWCSFFAKKS
jgi:High potential iron-sulfur protein